MGEPIAGQQARAVLALRLFLLLVAAIAAAAAVVAGPSWDRGRADSGVRYVCPMHPEVTSAAAGQCPVCGMDLERFLTGDEATNPAAIDPSTYLNYDIPRKRGIGPDAPAAAWVDNDGLISAILYKDELEGLPPDARATFSSASSAGPAPVRAVAGPAEVWDRSTSRVRFRLDEASSLPERQRPPAPGQTGVLRLLDKGRELPVIANSAILEGAAGPYVLVASADGRTLTARPVNIGKAFAGLTFVLSGVGARERVLVRSAFFVDAERRLRRQPLIEVKR